MVRRQARRCLDQGPAARRRRARPRGEFNIVIAGLAATAGSAHPQLGPLAAAYVLILAVAGPLLARTAEPLGRWLTKRAGGGTPGPSDGSATGAVREESQSAPV